MQRRISFFSAFMILVLAAQGLCADPQEPSFLGKPLSKWMEELGSQDARIRRSAAFALGKIGFASVQAVPKLTKLLKDKNAGVREAAASALGDVGLTGWEGTLPGLIEVLAHDSDTLVKAGAAMALGKLGHQAAANENEATDTIREALEKALADAQPSVRQNAAWALGRLGAKKGAAAVPALSRALEDADPLVRRDAAAALRELGPGAHAAVAPLLAHFKSDKDPEVRKTALNALVNIVAAEDRAIAKDLRAALRSDDAEIVRAAALALANIGGNEASAAVPVLCEVLADKEVSNRRLAAAALARVGEQAAPGVTALSKALSDRDAVVRRNAALALAHIGPRAAPAVSALAEVVGSKQPDEVRLYAAEAIANIGPNVEPAVPTLRRVLKEDSNWRIRQRAVWALSHLEGPERAEIVPSLSAVLTETDPGSRILRYESAIVLGMLQAENASDKTIDILQALLNDKDVGVYKGAQTNVKSAGSEARNPDAGVAQNVSGDSRWMAAEALARIGKKANRPDIIKSLKEAAEASDPKVRDAAKEALRKIQG
jgi:HEAT repeat protein